MPNLAKSLLSQARQPTNPVLEAMADIVNVTDTELKPLIKMAAEKFEMIISYNEYDNELISQGYVMDAISIKNLYEEFHKDSYAKKYENFKNLKLSNTAWAELINSIAGGDTIDTKNILVLWNTLRDIKDKYVQLTATNIKGLQFTCNYIDRKSKTEFKACNNYVGVNEDLCSIHYVIREDMSKCKFENAVFPILFGNYTFYITAKYENYLIGKKPFSFKLSRSLNTILFKQAKGNKNRYYKTENSWFLEKLGKLLY